MSHLRLAFELGFIPGDLYRTLTEAGNEIDRMINGYIGYLKRSKIGANEPGAPGLLREEKGNYSLEPIDLSDHPALRSLFSSPDLD
ncbi:MAG TPA: hypothetical protein VMT46_12380 [Anaerolineaceae bacterium]|nr:hypothetical protein [Anaerolineaceae bacterium]